METKNHRKISRKVKRCERILQNHQNISFSKSPTRNLFIGNGGLGCGLTREALMHIFVDFGEVQNIVMNPEKPYSFLVFSEVENAVQATTSLNGKKLTSNHTFYLSYICDANVPEEIVRESSWPQGLVLLEDFVTEEEEIKLLQEICPEEDSDENCLLKHRRVKHYGYEFIYGSNNINKSEPLVRKIPDICIPHLKKLVALGFLPSIPDQLTVNHYLPGQGIPPHIDTHSAFEDGIVSLSLSSQVVMDFYCPPKEVVSVLLPRRSALIMLGESRYLWKHGITPRKMDVVKTKDGNHLTLNHRAPRTSLTFRIIRKAACDCDYRNQCDSQLL